MDKFQVPAAALLRDCQCADEATAEVFAELGHGLQVLVQEAPREACTEGNKRVRGGGGEWGEGRRQRAFNSINDTRFWHS